MKALKGILAAWLFVLCAGVAQAWLRPEYEDATVVERSELIVVAHIKEGSIMYVPHDKKSWEGASWEHHATLVIREVLKGKCADKEIPIIIHYGLDPVVEGYVKRDAFTINNRGSKNDYPKGIIQIRDTGGNKGFELVKDARNDNLWFLRKRTQTA
jgi:hypothetical protein